MVENTLSVGKISEGFVLDHIEAGKSMEIYKYLHLDKLDCCVAIIKNAKSSKMGQKCDPLQKSALHHIHRTGAGSYLRPD